MTVDGDMVRDRWDGRRYGTNCRLLIDARYHPVHCSGDILPDSSANSYSCHHSRRIKSCAAAAEFYTACAVFAHMTERFRSGNADLSLFFNLKCADVCRLCLLMLRILAFLTLNAESFHIVGGFRLHFSGCYILGDGHELTIAIALLVDLNRTDIYTRNSNTEGFL